MPEKYWVTLTAIVSLKLPQQLPVTARTLYTCVAVTIPCFAASSFSLLFSNLDLNQSSLALSNSSGVA